VQWTTLIIVVSILAALVAACFALALVPLRLELFVKGQGEVGKFWAVGLGLRVSFVTISFAAAQGVDSVLQLHLFGLKVWRRSPAGGLPAPEEESKVSLDELLAKARRLQRETERWFDLDSMLVFLVDLRHHVRLKRCNGRLSYATPDVAITGMIAGALYTLAGLLLPFGDCRIEPQWEDVAKASGQFDAACKVYPGRMVLSAIAFVFKNIKLRQRTCPIVPAPP